MPKLSDYKPIEDGKAVDNELIERVEGMMNDSFFDFALEDLEMVYNYIQQVGKVKDWMLIKLDTLEKYKERMER